MNHIYEAMLERLRRAGVPQEIIEAIWADERFGHDLKADQNVVEGLIESHRRGLIHIGPGGVLEFTEAGKRAIEAEERRKRIGDPVLRPRAIKLRPEVARRFQALFPRMARIEGDVVHLSDDVLARIRAHMRPGETEGDLIDRMLDRFRDGQLDDLMRGLS